LCAAVRLQLLSNLEEGEFLIEMIACFIQQRVGIIVSLLYTILLLTYLNGKIKEKYNIYSNLHLENPTVKQMMASYWKRIPSVVKTSCMVGGSMFVGDIMCQKIESKTSGKEWDKKRSQIMGIAGLCISGPINHNIIYALEKYLPGNSVRASLLKMGCNSLMAPVTMSILFTAVMLMKGKNLQDAKEKIVRDVPTTWVTAAGYLLHEHLLTFIISYWPIVGFLNFRYTPIQYRAVVGSIAGIIWNTFMSSQTNKDVVRENQVIIPALLDAK
jgi:protein Mpv17